MVTIGEQVYNQRREIIREFQYSPTYFTVSDVGYAKLRVEEWLQMSEVAEFRAFGMHFHVIPEQAEEVIVHRPDKF